MVMRHKPLIRAPYYADEGDGALIHRYLHEDFVVRHLQAMQQGQLQGNRAQTWRFQDRFTEDKSLPWLRLPIHRTFYMVSCEVVCDAVAHPAFNPQNIRSAGFVVRRRDGARWLQTNGVALGWQAGGTADDDPDHGRQLRRQKLIRPRLPEPASSGEESYPLHAQLLDASRADGSRRKHTLLYGFLPLSGSVQNTSLENPSDYFVDILPWPFGRQGQPKTQVLVWRRGDGHVLKRGKPEKALSKLINQLLTQFQLLDDNIAANRSLHELMQTVHFYRMPDSDRYRQTRQLLASVAKHCSDLAGALGSSHPQFLALRAVRSTLPHLSFPSLLEAEEFDGGRLAEDANDARDWLSGVRALVLKIGAAPLAAEWVKLHAGIAAADSSLRALESYLSNIGNFRLQSLQAYFEAHKAAFMASARLDQEDLEALPGIDADSHLFFSEQQAMRLRELLFERSTSLTKDYVDSLQIPRYQQGAEDVYYIKPFVRYLDEGGCEQIAWGVNSEAFRVAAPFDPEASRPQSIQLPKFSDLKRGLAKGATFVAPKDLAEKMKNIGLEMPPTEKKGDSFGLEWIISFSLPVVTICAMLLLMIVLNVLNLIFQWLPYAITLIPKPK